MWDEAERERSRRVTKRTTKICDRVPQQQEMFERERCAGSEMTFMPRALLVSGNMGHHQDGPGPKYCRHMMGMPVIGEMPGTEPEPS
jgi:hypothetical protein